MGDHLGLSRWPRVVTRVPGNRTARIHMNAPQEDATLQALKSEEGAVSQEMQVASQSRKDVPP